MADLEQRLTFEGKLAAQLAGAGARQMRKVATELESPDAYANIPPSLWEEMQQELAREISDDLEKVFMAAALAMLLAFSLPAYDLADLQLAASTWATAHAMRLASDTSKTTSAALDQLLARAKAEGWEQGRLRGRILGLFGAQRAETIAITEVTRAVSAGEAFALGLIAAAGVLLEPYHYTAEDERVCQICGSRHGKRITDGFYAPLHPRCRCYTLWQVRR